VVEPALMTTLPNILDASKILEMPEALIEEIGSESEKRRTERDALRSKLEIFERSSIICQIYVKSTGSDSRGHHVRENNIADRDIEHNTAPKSPNGEAK
jgi:hypothetical protein